MIILLFKIRIFYVPSINMKQCLYCGSSVEIIEGRKPKQFCGYNCRNKYYYKKSREGLPPKKRGRPIIVKENGSENFTGGSAKTNKIVENVKKVPPATTHDQQKIDTQTTLSELKAMCPPELTGIDRSAWISEQRQKYNL